MSEGRERIREMQAAYEAHTGNSRRCFEAAGSALPGGDSRSTLHYPPYPVFFDRAEGGRLTDVDGNEYLDFTANHSALIHGNRPASVHEAVAEQLARGSCFPGPTEAQIDLASHLTGRVPSMDLVRFCNSGTEATMNAIRAARAATGRHRIAKAEGAYHGSEDDVFVSTHPDEERAGDADRPHAVPRAAGLGRSALTDTIIIPFNRPEAAAARIREAGGDLAAVLLEPMMGSAGMIPSTPGYANAVRNACTEVGAVLVFDEVVTFRLAYGGAEEWLGVRPDLTCLGKMVGGGLPLGAFGGRRDLMRLFDPTEGPVVGHPGSFNANPLCLSAGLAALERLTAEAIDAINRLGDRLRSELADVASTVELPLTVTGRGSLLALHVTDRPVREYRDTWSVDRELAHALFLGLICEGVMIDPRGAVCLSTATTDADVDAFVAAMRTVTESLSSPS